jgi:hypothetical protein
MDAGTHCQRVLFCGLSLLGACRVANAELITYPLTSSDFNSIPIESRWVLAGFAGVALLGILLSGKPGVRR